MARDVDKGPDAFRTISEVAEDLDLPQHVLRFWEGRFPQIKPLKRGGGRRYYRPDDIDLLKGIRHLLYGEGYTIRGVQRILKEQGVRSVMLVWQDGAPAPSGGRDDATDRAYDDDAFGFDDGFATGPQIAPNGPGDDDAFADEPVETAASIAQRFAPRLADAPQSVQRPGQRPAPQRFSDEQADPAHFVGARPAPQRPHVERPHVERPHVERPVSERPASERTPAERAAYAERLPAGIASDDDDDAPIEEGRSPFGALIDRFRPGHAPRGEVEPGIAPRLSRDDVRHLQATLFELLECKRLLDQAR